VRDPGLCGHASQRDAILEVGLQNQPAAMCLCPVGLAERRQGRLARCARHVAEPLPDRPRGGRRQICLVRLRRPV
jgi:hypothetical protein